MSFKAKVSIDANGIKEERSVLFIQTLLLGRTKNNIDKGTTQSNIDGYIELLDSSNRISGKITVQVKTVSKKDEGITGSLVLHPYSLMLKQRLIMYSF